MPAEMPPANSHRQTQQNQVGSLNAYSTAELAAELRRRQPDDYRERYDWQACYLSLDGIIAELEKRSQVFHQWAGPQPDSDNGWELASRQAHSAALIIKGAKENAYRAQAEEEAAAAATANPAS